MKYKQFSPKSGNEKTFIRWLPLPQVNYKMKNMCISCMLRLIFQPKFTSLHNLDITNQIFKHHFKISFNFEVTFKILSCFWCTQCLDSPWFTGMVAANISTDTQCDNIQISWRKNLTLSAGPYPSCRVLGCLSCTWVWRSWDERDPVWLWGRQPHPRGWRCPTLHHSPGNNMKWRPDLTLVVLDSYTP